MGEPGTRTFFEHVERRRYTREWHILSLVPFASGRGKTVVEVGCGLGTDAVQWAQLETCAIFEMEGLRSIFGSSITNISEDIIGRILGLGWHLFIFATK